MRTIRYLQVGKAADAWPDSDAEVPEVDAELSSPQEILSTIIERTSCSGVREVYLQTLRPDGTAARWQDVKSLSKLPDGLLKVKVVVSPGVAPSQEQLQEMIAQQVQQQLAQFGVLRDFFLHILDYSEGVISTAPSTANFKNMLVHQYSDRLDGEHGPMLWCMLLQMRLPKSLVIGSHLWKRAWHQHMWVLDLPAEEIDSIRNGVLLFKPIEWAFDTSRLCFELDDFGHYVPHLLDGRLQDTKLLDKLEELIQPQVLDSELKAFLSATLKVRDTGIDLTFGHLPTYWLKSAPNKEAPAPWSRVLEFQARRASLKAAELHWPHEPVTFITGSPYAARAAILQWFADTEEQAAAAGNPVAVVQQLP